MSSMFYSIIIPVYNRPDEIRELLESLTHQSYKSFEVLIVEDGSDKPCEEAVGQFSDQLQISYFFKENSGQGFSRNYGFARAKGDYFIVFDSDCIVPPAYLETVDRVIQTVRPDCWGGPDRAHPSFTAVQKAINYGMTSFLTTGGMRGSVKKVTHYYPRSFNMGISRKVFEATGGYSITRMGEDIEFSIRIRKAGFHTIFIEDAFVYHKRRTGLQQFFKQVHFFGRARVNISRFHPEELQFIHLIPVFFLLGIMAIPLLSLFTPFWSQSLLALYLVYLFLIFVSALIEERQLKTASLAVVATVIQFTAYAIGFVTEYSRKILADFGII